MFGLRLLLSKVVATDSRYEPAFSRPDRLSVTKSDYQNW